MATKKPGRGVNRKGHSKTRGKFVALGNGLLTSDAWRSLSGSAIRYYVELRRQFNGTNNGHLHLSHEQTKKTLGMGSHTVLRAQKELQDKGLIRMTMQGGFSQRLATTWALTDEAVPPMRATHDFKNWRRPKRKTSLSKRQPTHCHNDSDNVIELASSLPKRQRKTPNS